VIFDRSGSMGDPFQAFKTAKKGNNSDDETKIEAAKHSLLAWLRDSEFEMVTIIPFSTRADKKLTGSLQKNSIRIQHFIHNQYPDGDTNLQAAISRAIKIAINDQDDSYRQLLIVTDGLSHTTEKDLKLVHDLPTTQSISGILIDPTPEGEKHLRQLCVRGTYLSVTNKKELGIVLKKQNEIYTERIKLSKTIKDSEKKNEVVGKELYETDKQLTNFPKTHKKLRKIIDDSVSKNKEISKTQKILLEKIADQGIDVSEIANEINGLQQEQADLAIVVELLGKYDQLLRQLKILVHSPYLIAKGYKSTIVVTITPIEKQLLEISRQFRKLGKVSNFYNKVLVKDLTASVKISCSDISVSDEIVRKFSAGANIFQFTLTPNDNSHSGVKEAILTVYEMKTGIVYESRPIEIKIVDFAIGRLSWPLSILITTNIILLVSLLILYYVLFVIENYLVGAIVGIAMVIVAILGVAIYVQYFKLSHVVDSM
jgi:hypothetical protein